MAWVNWLAWYSQQTIAPASARTLNIGSIYQTWIKGVVGEYQSTLVSSISDLQTWWVKYLVLPPNAPATTNKADVPVDVRFAF